MAVKKLKPDTPSQRYMSVSSFDELTTNKPYRKLTTPIKKTGGRNNSGRITSRRRGGGHKRRYRIIDFKRNKFDVSGEVLTIEYDPNRSSRIALVNYADNEKRYIIAPDGIKVGHNIISSKSESIPFNVGNAMPLSRIPDGMLVHNIELKIGKGGQLSRSAGAYARIMAKEEHISTVLQWSTNRYRTNSMSTGYDSGTYRDDNLGRDNSQAGGILFCILSKRPCKIRLGTASAPSIPTRGGPSPGSGPRAARVPCTPN